MSAQHLGLRARIVMPRTTPDIKVDAVRSRGADVVLAGDTYADAYAFACDEASRTGATFIHPFDDLLVIAGQGTVGDEIVRQRPGDLDAIFIPSAAAGCWPASPPTSRPSCPSVRIIGVEPVDADAMARSLAAGHRVVLDRVGLFADGVAVREVGEHTFAIASQTVDEMVLVDNDAICAAIKDVFDDTRTIMEPAGALSVAGLKAWVAAQAEPPRGPLVAVLSGANMNFDRLRFVAERAELGEQREALFAVTIPERKGAFREFCTILGPRVDHRVQLPPQHPRGSAHLRRRRHALAGRCRRRAGAPAGGRLPRRRSHAERTGQAPRPLHGRAAGRATSRASVSAGSSSRSARAPCSSSSTRSAAAGTSACSTTATTAPTSAACWPASRCRPTTMRPSTGSSRRSAIGSAEDTGEDAYQRFLA